MAIPKIIHQFFAIGWDAVPDEAKEEIRALRQRNPDWDYRFYDAEAAEKIISEQFGTQYLEIYRSIDPAYAAARADLFRYLVCYKIGGLYLDIKSTVRKPLDTVIGTDDQYVLSQWSSARNETAKQTAHPELAGIPRGEYLQWFVACRAGHPFLSAVIDAVLRNIENYQALRDGIGRMGVLRLTGPIAYTLAINPILNQHPHVFRDYQDDLGFVYSVYGDISTHRTKLGSHYTTQTRPVISTNFLATAFCMFWFGPVNRARKWISWKILGLNNRFRALRAFFNRQ